jgi:DNA repair protein RadC
MSQKSLDEFKIAEIELTYFNSIPPHERFKVQSPDTAYQMFLKSWDAGKIDLQEQFKVMLLDTGCNFLGISTVSTGGISQCAVDQRLIFAVALKGKASQIILAHNHPSGNLTPSSEDIRLTQRMVQAGEILQIQVADHLILSRHGYASLKDKLTF